MVLPDTLIYLHSSTGKILLPFAGQCLLCLLVTVILKVLNWGIYRSHEIFVMMKPGFLSNLNSCIPFKAWLHGWWIYNRSFIGKNILLGHKVEGCIRDLNKTYCRYPLRYVNSLNYTWKTCLV